MAIFFNHAIMWDNVENYGTAGQATEGNMVRVHYMLDT